MENASLENDCSHLQPSEQSSAKNLQPEMDDLAAFPISIDLPGNDEFVARVAKAVHAEYRKASTWKKLKCVKVETLENDPDLDIYILYIGEKVEFSWTWEGAKAFRPSAGGSLQGARLNEMIAAAEQGENADVSWFGDVVEVDEVEGKIYVSATDSENKPTTGVFYVRPFEFLEALNSIYRKEDYKEMRTDLLQGRLMAVRGGLHPAVLPPVSNGLSELNAMWRHAWAILWGPPGTGKTYTIGKQISKIVHDPSERVLVISTTNKATDGVALSIGKHTRNDVKNCRILRMGKNSDYKRFEAEGLKELLRGTETDLMRTINILKAALKKTQDKNKRAKINQNIQRLQVAMKDRAIHIFTSTHTQVVISTAFRALTLIKDPSVRDLLNHGKAPFTTIIIDEAGLLSRATTAVLSMLASRRVVLVGDPKQLAPISQMSRVLPQQYAIWLGGSGLSHLVAVEDLPVAVHMLTKQYRMVSEIRKVVSEYQYNGKLKDAEEIRQKCPDDREGSKDLFGNRISVPPVMWYVLDEEANGNLPAIRAERGPGNKSWVRPITTEILDKLLELPEIKKRESGMFISPFAAQAREIRTYLSQKGLEHWTASTVHSQQGAEAEVVIFDTVNASSQAWPADEWKRLVNVGISRAECQVILLASRLEMQQPFLRSLKKMMPSGIVNSQELYQEVPETDEHVILPEQFLHENPALLGSQIQARRELLPVMSAEQQRLSRLRMDGKPRLVRGVAGSGKTIVLAHWLAQVVAKMKADDERIWVVYGNNALRPLIQEMIQSAWETEIYSTDFPWEYVKLLHVKDVLKQLGDELWEKRRHAYRGGKFDYNAQSRFILDHLSPGEIETRCTAMFIDEAQDMGPDTLRLLTLLVSQTDLNAPNSRAVNIFYDNAQNIYQRPVPKWSELGLDMRGRSTVMKESFRSTQPITEFAINVLYNLQPPESDPEYRELIARNLIEKVQRNGQDYWRVNFTVTQGVSPRFRRFTSLYKEFDAIARQIIQWVTEEAVTPGDITILYNNKAVRKHLEMDVASKLKQKGILVDFQTGRYLTRDKHTVLVTTTPSFKGYDSEIVLIAAADMFVAWDENAEGGKKVLANTLYTAMTRARSILQIYAFANTPVPASRRISTVLQTCYELLEEAPKVDEESSNAELFASLLNLIGKDYGSWLKTLWDQYDFQIEPLLTDEGELLAEPLFWFKNDMGQGFACFGNEPVRTVTRNALEDHGIVILQPGETI